MHRPGDNSGSGSSLENASWLEDRAALGDEVRVRFKQDRAHVPVAKRGSRLCEYPLGHWCNYPPGYQPQSDSVA